MQGEHIRRKGNEMAHKKYGYYTVAQGEEKGIYDDWETCRTRVDRYKGNRYKGFYTLEEAVAYAQKHIALEEGGVWDIQGIRKETLVKDLGGMERPA